jgi:ComF family protein
MGLGICRECWSQVEGWEGISCERCGLPVVSVYVADSTNVLCGACRLKDPSFDLARTFGIYRGNLRLLILQLKFHRRERLGRRLGEMLAQTWTKLGAIASNEPLLIVPVPLFRTRERERGFNQSRLLAEGMCHRLENLSGAKRVEVHPRLLVRTRATLPQAGLKIQARRENVRGAFEVVKPDLVQRRQILLVDDVMTTGATLSACAAVLKKRGAARVYALAVGRATPQFPDTDGLAQATGVDEFGRHWT